MTSSSSADIIGQVPSWKVEKKYSNDVLIGNWYENRREFERKIHDHNATYRADYKHYPNFQPDVMIRRQVLKRSEGVQRDQLLYHHGNRYKDNIYISLYDDNYNHRERTNPLPELRRWDGRHLAWLPERSDHPGEGRPTNWGLLQSQQDIWEKQMAMERLPHLATNYQLNYMPPKARSRLSACERYARPRESSTPMHAPNKTLKNLKLRDKACLSMPEALVDPCKA